MEVFVALAGEYDIQSPLGVFESIEPALECIKNSKPSYNTEIEKWNTKTGTRITTYYINCETWEISPGE